jgi:hypothetical protein
VTHETVRIVVEIVGAIVAVLAVGSLFVLAAKAWDR